MSTSEPSYHPLDTDQIEDENTIVQGEDPDDYSNDGAKPVRILSKFAIYDPKPGHNYELISLDLLHETSGIGRQFEAAGYVSPVYLSEEDAGQEDGVEAEEGLERLHLRTSAIFHYFIDYQERNGCGLIHSCICDSC